MIVIYLFTRFVSRGLSCNLYNVWRGASRVLHSEFAFPKSNRHKCKKNCSSKQRDGHQTVSNTSEQHAVGGPFQIDFVDISECLGHQQCYYLL